MIIDIDKLKNIRKKNIDKKIVLALGSFDLFHWEHLKYLNDASLLGDILVVAIKNDQYVALKGVDRPIIKQEQRLEVVDNIKSVDYCVLCNKRLDFATLHNKLKLQPNQHYNKPWLENFYSIFEALQPDILYHEENNELQSDREAIAKHFNIKLVSRKRTAIVSTTYIINKIKHTQHQ